MKLFTFCSCETEENGPVKQLELTTRRYKSSTEKLNMQMCPEKVVCSLSVPLSRCQSSSALHLNAAENSGFHSNSIPLYKVLRVVAHSSIGEHPKPHAQQIDSGTRSSSKLASTQCALERRRLRLN